MPLASAAVASRCQSILLAADFGQVGYAVHGGDAAERRAGFDGLQLFGVADQDHFGVGFFGEGEDTLELVGADHAGLVDHEDIAAAQGVAAVRPGEFVAREGAGLDAGGNLQVLGGDSGERRAFDRVAFGFPDLAHGGECGALAGAGDAGEGFQIAAAGHFDDGALLLGTQAMLGEYRGSALRVDVVIGALGQIVGVIEQAALGGEHLASGKALPAAIIDAEGHKFGRGGDFEIGAVGIARRSRCGCAGTSRGRDA